MYIFYYNYKYNYETVNKLSKNGTMTPSLRKCFGFIFKYKMILDNIRSLIYNQLIQQFSGSQSIDVLRLFYNILFFQNICKYYFSDNNLGTINIRSIILNMLIVIAKKNLFCWNIHFTFYLCHIPQYS